eukprot:gene26393-7083_t
MQRHWAPPFPGARGMGGEPRDPAAALGGYERQRVSVACPVLPRTVECRGREGGAGKDLEWNCNILPEPPAPGPTLANTSAAAAAAGSAPRRLAVARL